MTESEKNTVNIPDSFLDNNLEKDYIIKEYIADQLKRDKESDQLSMYDPRDPFTGSK